MSIDTNERIARLWFEVMWSEPNFAVADEIVAAEYAPVWIQIPKKGPELLKHEIKYFRSVFPDLKYAIVEMSALSDRVWVRYQVRGTQEGPAWGFPASGKTVQFDGASILYIRDGQVFDQWGSFSFYDMLTDLGVVPPLWELKKYLNWNL